VSEISGRPNIAQLEIPVDAWTQPFWDAARDHRLVLPSCGACGRFRWPPGPFCPHCQSQEIVWADAGDGFVFSYTIVPGKLLESNGPSPKLVPALIEFPKAGNVRLTAAIVDSAIADIRIGAMVLPVWVQAKGAIVPMFRLA
jgi:uncharacterized OB-fold protein